MAPPKIGPAAFWEMVALTIRGRLASCVSCVEFFYFQSTANSSLFLEACASAGLLQRMSLLDLFGDVGPRIDPGQSRYDEPIYLSAPEFRSAHPQEARKRLDVTKNTVNTALRIFLEELRNDDGVVASAYETAVRENRLRFSEIAAERRGVRMSSLAKVRLMLDGFRVALSKGDDTGKGTSRERDRLIVSRTIQFIRGFVGTQRPEMATTDFGEELQQFTLDFLAAPERVREFDSDHQDLAADYWVRWLPVLLNVAWGRFNALKNQVPNENADRFAKAFSHAAEGAARREQGKAAGDLLNALSQEWEWMISAPPGTELTPWLSPIIDVSSNLHSS